MAASFSPRFFFCAPLAFAQDSAAPIHVTMTVNPDGTRTSNQTDLAQRESIATTTTAKGKLLKKIIYRLEEQGRYESGRVFSASGALQLKTVYRYDEQGRLAEEKQLDKNDRVLHRIIYSFDVEGSPQRLFCLRRRRGFARADNAEDRGLARADSLGLSEQSRGISWRYLEAFATGSLDFFSG